MMGKIRFGTDGWRGVIAEDYTFNNVRRCAQGFSDYLLSQGWIPISVCPIASFLGNMLRPFLNISHIVNRGAARRRPRSETLERAI